MEYQYIIGLGAYFALMLGIGFWVKNKISTAEDYLVAGRSFNMFFNTATLTSCFIGGAVVIAIPGTTYSTGIWNDEFLWGSIISAGGGVACLVVAGLFYMPKLWRLKLLSLGDFFYNRYGHAAGLMATCLIAFTFVFWVAVQVLVFAKVAGSILGWGFVTSILVAVIVICAYTLMGGLWAVCMTDVVQVSLVVLGLCILTPLTIDAVGGWDTFVANIPKEKTQVVPHVASAKVFLAYFGAWIMIGLGSVTSPDLMQRSFSAKTPAVARNSAIAAALITWFTVGLVLCLTYAGEILINAGALPGDIINDDPELLLPLLFKTIMPTGLVVLFLGACLAAVISAADSALLALAGMLSKNIVKDVVKPDLSDKGLVTASRALVLTASVLATIIAISLPSAFTLLALCFDLILCCLFGPLTLGLYFKKTNAYGTIAGMIVGLFCRVVVAGFQSGFSLEGIALLDNWYLYTVLSPVACIVTMVVVSLLTQKQNPPIALQEHD